MPIGLEKQFKQLIKPTVVVKIAKKSGTNKYGEDTYDTTHAVTYPAYVVRATKQVRTKDGSVKVSTAQVYLMSDIGVQPDDQITLPDGTKPVILHIGSWSDERGPYTQCIYC